MKVESKRERGWQMLHLTPTAMREKLKIPFFLEASRGSHPESPESSGNFTTNVDGNKNSWLYLFLPAYQAIFKSLSSIGRNLTNLENNKSMLLALFFMSDYTLMLRQTPSASKEASAFARTVAFSEWKKEKRLRGMRKIINCLGHFLCCTSPVIWAGLLPLETRTGRFSHIENRGFLAAQLWMENWFPRQVKMILRAQLGDSAFCTGSGHF